MTRLTAVEGFYGPPLAPRERLDLVRWLASVGYDSYAYAPKNDPYHRERWRDPYPEGRAAELRELIATGRDCGVEVALAVSPGLDWRSGSDDEALLLKKLQSFVDLGARSLAIAWDDVPPGGADLGEVHGRAVSSAVSSLGDGVDWFTCPTDYAASTPTAYLRAFAQAIPSEIPLLWTGPSIVSPEVPIGMARDLGRALDRQIMFGENYPVNDGLMGGVLHLGPYPHRPAELVDEVVGVAVNFMSLPRASRIGLELASSWWRDPRRDLERAWLDCLARWPGLEPLARACRSWIAAPGPDPALLAWWRSDRETFRNYLESGCRDLPETALANEVEPWLEQWDLAAQAMLSALRLEATPADHGLSYQTAMLWGRCRLAYHQVFGIRWAYYPITRRVADDLLPDPAALVSADTLTDLVCRRALGTA